MNDNAGKGFVLFAVAKYNNNPYFLKFGYSNGLITHEVSTPEEATVYPIYEAAEAVLNTLKGSDRYLLVKIFDADGNPCENGGGANGKMARDTRYVSKSSSNDDFF